METPLTKDFHDVQLAVTAVSCFVADGGGDERPKAPIGSRLTLLQSFLLLLRGGARLGLSYLCDAVGKVLAISALSGMSVDGETSGMLSL